MAAERSGLGLCRPHHGGQVKTQRSKNIKLLLDKSLMRGLLHEFCCSLKNLFRQKLKETYLQVTLNKRVVTRWGHEPHADMKLVGI